MGHNPGDVAWLDGGLWVAAADGLTRIDGTSNATTSYPIAVNLASLEGGKGVLYVTTDVSPPKLSPVAADKQASFLLSEDWLDDTDPAHAYPSAFRAQLEYATGAQLLNYPDASGPRGARLVPEVAAAMPAVTGGGRTYTFRIRPGYRFSPPSGKPVTAATFRYSIERALSPKLGPDAAGYSYLSDVVGASAFHAGKTQHVAGITVSGDRLRIRLVAPAGDFLTRLSLPYFAAVPLHTPIVAGGVQTPIPSAGPYYLGAAFEDQLVVLERNPNYHGPRPAKLERITYDLNTFATHAVQNIEAGKADYTADVIGDSQFKRGGLLDTRYGARPSPRGCSLDALRAGDRRRLHPVQHPDRRVRERPAPPGGRPRARAHGSRRRQRQDPELAIPSAGVRRGWRTCRTIGPTWHRPGSSPPASGAR